MPNEISRILRQAPLPGLEKINVFRNNNLWDIYLIDRWCSEILAVLVCLLLTLYSLQNPLTECLSLINIVYLGTDRWLFASFYTFTPPSFSKFLPLHWRHKSRSGMMEGRLLRLDRRKQSSDYSTESWHLKNSDTLGVAISPQQLSIKPSPLLEDTPRVCTAMRARRDHLIDNMAAFLGRKEYRGKEGSPGTAWYSTQLISGVKVSNLAFQALACCWANRTRWQIKHRKGKVDNCSRLGSLYHEPHRQDVVVFEKERIKKTQQC